MVNTKQSDNKESRQAGRGGVSGTAATRPASADPFHPHLAESVTRQVQISGPVNWKHLLTGIDSLDLGVHVEWPDRWFELVQSMAKAKENAAGTKGIPWDRSPLDNVLILPNGKQPMYAFHLQTPELHIFLARTNRSSKYPNVYISTTAQALWLDRPCPTIERISDFIIGLGGNIERMQVSRCDLCCDFLIPGGLTLEFLREFKVSRSRAWKPYLTGDNLETFYVGGNGGELQCRIYNKAIEVSRDGSKSWFLNLWKIKELCDVWRVEFQIRRDVLRQFCVDSFDDLVKKSGGIWTNLTTSWLSFRLQDDPNPTRRTVHPWWQAVQEVAIDFGSGLELKRQHKRPKSALAEWYIAHGAGCLVGYAARRNLPCLNEAMRSYMQDAEAYWAQKNFEERYRIERIRLGFDDTELGAT